MVEGDHARYQVEPVQTGQQDERRPHDERVEREVD